MGFSLKRPSLRGLFLVLGVVSLLIANSAVAFAKEPTPGSPTGATYVFVPGNWLFVLACVLSVAYFATNIRGLYRRLRIAQKVNRIDDIGGRVGDLIAFVVAQARMFKIPYTVAGLLHAFTFWGFLILGIGSIETFAKGIFPELQIPGLEGNPVYYFVEDLFTGLVIIAVVSFFIRRVVVKSKRLDLVAEGLVILGLIFLLMTTDLLADGLRSAYGSTLNNFRAYYGESGAFLANPVGQLFWGSGKDGLWWGYGIVWWVHTTTLMVFLNYLPFSKHLHIFTAPFNVFFRPSTPKGQLSTLDLENSETFGVAKLEELSWKDLLDTYTCTHCGRCDDNCPAYLNAQPLSPKRIVLNIGEYLGERHPLRGKPAEQEKVLAGEVCSEESLWSCTTCRACMHFCPVFIEHIPKIIDMRRYLVLTESKFPPEVTSVFNNMERNGNPWEISWTTRGDWANGLDIKTLAEDSEVEYLYWVGCFGSYDERNKKITVAFANILKQAGINFGILGQEERCTGDPARRAGNEYLFQMMAQQNVETLNGYKVKKIITTCPHCFNTLKNEYTQFGGSYEVIHHSVFLADLIAQGKIKISKELQRTITMHDPCYLGRYNDVYEEPRKVLEAIPGVRLVEMDRSRGRAMCCGGGGARAFMEDHHGVKINEARVTQAIAVNPDVIGTACPFCMTMLEDGVKTKGVDEKMRPVDIAELLAEAMTVPVATKKADTTAP